MEMHLINRYREINFC